MTMTETTAAVRRSQKRIELLTVIAVLFSAACGPARESEGPPKMKTTAGQSAPTELDQPQQDRAPNEITIFLCGDVMTGRGIDQALPHPGDPTLQEAVVKDARRYVNLAERVNGPIFRPLDFDSVWGDALQELQRTAPDVRIINLETSVTQSERFRKNKGIHYRMNPANVPVLTAAGIDCCALANNHVLDWGRAGLSDTINALRKANIRPAGAGENLKEAQAPAILPVEGKGRVLVFSFGFADSGIPIEWAAGENSPGVHLLEDFSESSVQRVADAVRAAKRDGDIAIASIHWGSNWGYPAPNRHRRFAHRLIDVAEVDLIHGHSSHHPRGMEVHRGRLILYGAGDFVNDYEGISGYERYRGDLSLMYFASLRPAVGPSSGAGGELVRLRMVPLQMRRFQLRRASPQDAAWLRDALTRAGRPFGTSLELIPDDGTLRLQWQ